jgi:AcrR family transcriptional regulator
VARSTPTYPPTTATAPGTKPHGTDAVIEALVASATQLFSVAGLAKVSVRDIARRAGVNHALVFRHFGSKVGLLNAVLERLGNRLSTALDDANPREAMTADIQLYAGILARALLDGAPAESYRTGHPIVRRLISEAQSEGLDDRQAAQLAAVLIALELGWTFYRPFITSATGLDELSPPTEIRTAFDATTQLIRTHLTQTWTNPSRP